MKSYLKLFSEDSKELEMLIKNKLSLLQSPVDILNEKEVKEIKTNFAEYSKKIEKLTSSINMLNEITPRNNNRHEYNTEPIENTKQYEKQYEAILKAYKEMQSQIEAHIIEYEEKQYQKQNAKQMHRSRTGSYTSYTQDTASEFSDYEDTDKLEISRIFLNSVISTNQVNVLQSKSTLQEEQKYILEIFNLSESYPNSNSKQQILIDFYINNYKFCLKHKFSIEKISTYLSIIYFIFTFSVMNKKIIKEKSASLFKDIIEYHSLNRPPYSYEVFNKEEKLNIITFVNSTFYRNYTLFENIFKYNLNIYFTSSEFKKIPKLPDTTVMTKETMVPMDAIKNIAILEKLYFNNTDNKDKAKNNSDGISNNNSRDVKSADEIREEQAIEKLKTFVSSFYKSKDTADKEKLIEEQLRLGRLTEFEVNEAKVYLENKIPEIVKESSDKIVLASKEVLKMANSNVEKVMEPPKKK